MSRHHGIVKEFFDTNFGEVTKLNQLSNARGIYDELLGKQRNLEHQLSVIRTEVPTKIEGAIRLAEATLSEGAKLVERKEDLVRRIHHALAESEPIDRDLNGMVLQVEEIERFVIYLQLVERVEGLSGDIQRCILCGSFTDACNTFSHLIAIENRLTIQDHSKCESLVKFITDTIFYWNKILIERLSEYKRLKTFRSDMLFTAFVYRELDVILKKIGWPYILAPGASHIPKVVAGGNDRQNSKTSPGTNPSTDLAGDFERVFNNLLHIQLPDHLLKAEMQTEDRLALPESYILLPIQLMLKPLRKRFRYHFSGNKPTNSIAKPEWYFTQILNWVGNHKDFLEVTVQPIIESNGFKVDSLAMFTKGLLRLVNRKLAEDIDQLLVNDDIFSHTVDEVLLFDRELRGAHHFSPFTFEKENPLNVFMSAECIQKWISIEKACALDRLDAMLSSTKAWEAQYGAESGCTEAVATEGKSDEMMVPECAESFITMLLTITDRYKCIPTAGFQFKFLELQMHLLDDFRIRLTQVLKNESSDSPLNDRHFAVLNATYYVSEVLKEWAENSFFVELKYKKDKEDVDGTQGSNEVVPRSLLNFGERKNSQTDNLGYENSVFDAILRLYEHLHKDGVEQVARIIFSEFEIKAWSYASERTACPMLLVLQERIGLLNRKLCPRMFTSCWHKVTDKVDTFLYEQVVMRSKFNVGGALQLQFDMTRNLFPLFGPYTRNPENSFRRMKEACILLNLQPGSAMLLSEVLHSLDCGPKSNASRDPNAQIVNPNAALNDIHISLLSPDDAANILRLRIDWPLNN